MATPFLGSFRQIRNALKNIPWNALLFTKTKCIDIAEIAIGVVHLFFNCLLVILNRRLVILLNLPHTALVHEAHIKVGIAITQAAVGVHPSK